MSFSLPINKLQASCYHNRRPAASFGLTKRHCAFQAYQRPAMLAFGVEWFGHHHPFTPRCDRLNVGKKSVAPRQLLLGSVFLFGDAGLYPLRRFGQGGNASPVLCQARAGWRLNQRLLGFNHGHQIE